MESNLNFQKDNSPSLNKIRGIPAWNSKGHGGRRILYVNYSFQHSPILSIAQLHETIMVSWIRN